MIPWKLLCLYSSLLKSLYVDDRIFHTLTISIKKIEGWQRDWATERFMCLAKRQAWGWAFGLLSPSLGLFPGRWEGESRNASLLSPLMFSFLLPWNSFVEKQTEERAESSDIWLVLSFAKESGHRSTGLLHSQHSELSLPGARTWWQFPTRW